MIKARVTVTLKPGVLDPQGKAIEHALAAMDFGGVGSVRQGKVFDIELAESDRATAEAGPWNLVVGSNRIVNDLNLGDAEVVRTYEYD
mgnify:CR=1 FL=1